RLTHDVVDGQLRLVDFQHLSATLLSGSIKRIACVAIVEKRHPARAVIAYVVLMRIPGEHVGGIGGEISTFPEPPDYIAGACSILVVDSVHKVLMARGIDDVTVNG